MMKQNPTSILIALLLLAVLLSGCPKNQQHSPANRVTSTTKANVNQSELDDFCLESGAMNQSDLLALLQGFKLNKDSSNSEIPGKSYLADFASEQDREDFIAKAFAPTGMDRYRKDTNFGTIDIVSDGISKRAVSIRNLAAEDNNGSPGLLLKYMDFPDQQTLGNFLSQMYKVPWQ